MSRIHAAALAAALLLGISGVAAAQGRPQGQGAPGPRHGMRGRGDFGGGLVKELNLTETQKTQINAIHQKYRSQFESIRKQVNPQAGTRTAPRINRDSARVLRQKGDSARRGSRPNISPELRQRMLTLRQQEQTEIRNVLTAQQRTKFDAAQAQRKKWMDEHKNDRGGRRFQRG